MKPNYGRDIGNAGGLKARAITKRPFEAAGSISTMEWNAHWDECKSRVRGC